MLCWPLVLTIIIHFYFQELSTTNETMRKDKENLKSQNETLNKNLKQANEVKL